MFSSIPIEDGQSIQTRYQKKHKKKGQCTLCPRKGHKRADGKVLTLCTMHRSQKRKYQKNYYDNNKTKPKREGK